MPGNHVTFVPNMASIDLVRRLPKLRAEINRRADALAAACNNDFVMSHQAHDPDWVDGDSKNGYRVGHWDGKSRYRATVITATQHAINDNLRDKTLIRHLEVLYL